MKWLRHFSILCVVLGCSLPLWVSSGCGRSARSTEASSARAAGLPEAAAIVAEDLGEGSASAGSAEDAMAAVRQAADAGKYLFAFFWKEDDQQTQAMRQVFNQATSQVEERADAVSVQVTDPAQKAIVDEYGLDRAPMPLVLALAPNGAITGGFPAEFSGEDLLGAFASPCTEKCMKLLQEGKLVLLCVQGAKTQGNDEALKGARDFQGDGRFSAATEIIMLDPNDAAEKSFLADLQITAATEQAVTVFLVPPGSPIAMFEGPVSKELLVEALEKAGSSCCPGGSCGPGGCSGK